MEKLFVSFSKYFLLGGTKEELENLKKQAGKMSGKYQKKASRFSKKLKKELEKMGFDPDFESFCSMLENYVNIKDNMKEEEKKEYLEILTRLSYIHDVDLRSELERYVSYKEIIPTDEDQKEIFHKFCHYYLRNNNSVEEYNELKDLVKKYNINLEEYQSEAISYIENLKNISEELNLDIEKSLEELVTNYNQRKKELTSEEKEKYLRLLTPLSYIEGKNLRELLTHKEETVEEPKIEKYTNPLDNNEMLEQLLKERYETGSFSIKEIKLQNLRESEDLDYPKEQAKLLYKILHIYLDKYNNYCQNELNEETLYLQEEDIYDLNNLREEDIYLFLTEDSNNFTDNQIDFLNFAISTIDLRIEHIGTNEMSLFKTSEEKEDYTIYLNGPERETIYVLNEYIKKCIKENLSYNMTGLWSGGDSTERSLIFSSKENLEKKLSILDTIKEEHPSWIDFFGTPVLSASTTNSYYGISINKITNQENTKEIPYNDYFNSVCEVAYYRTLSKIVINKVEKEKDKDILNDFINLTNYQEDPVLKLPEFSKYNNVDFNIIKDLINTYIPEIIDTLNKYLETEQIQNLRTEFKKSIQYISNLVQGHNKKDSYNIALDI